MLLLLLLPPRGRTRDQESLFAACQGHAIACVLLVEPAAAAAAPGAGGRQAGCNQLQSGDILED